MDLGRQVQVDKEGGATASDIEIDEAWSMALGSRAIQSTGCGVPVPAYTDSRSTPAPSLPASPWNTLSISAASSLSQGPHSGGRLCPRALPKAFLRVCRSPSSSSSPALCPEHRPSTFLLCISSSSHPSPLSGHIVIYHRAWTREGSGAVCGIECRLVREEAWYFLGHPDLTAKESAQSRGLKP